MKADRQTPVQKFSAGSVHSAIWANTSRVNGRDITTMKASLDRRYTDAKGEWKTSNSYGRNEIPLAILALQRAYEYIVDHPVERRTGDGDGDDDSDDDLIR